MSPKLMMPTVEDALPGREAKMPVPERHAVNGTPLESPFPRWPGAGDVRTRLLLGRRAEVLAGAGGLHDRGRLRGRLHKNPTYEEVCSGRTGHAEVVLVVFDPAKVTYEGLLKRFWENHDPTQGMRQGNDAGTQYRSGIYVYSDEQRRAAERSKEIYDAALRQQGYRPITTEIQDAPPFYYAEAYHQQYLAKNPGGYCGLGGTGVKCSL